MKAVFALVFAVFMCAVAPAHAQGVPVPCEGFDTTVNGTTPFAIMTVCNVVSGPQGTILATANAEATCGAAGETVQMFVGTGTSPVAGGNFLGTVSGGTLTIPRDDPACDLVYGTSCLVPGTGVSPWLIQPGQYLTGGTGVQFTPTQIIAQLTSNELDMSLGKTGTYSIADGSLSIGSLSNLYTLNPLPGGMTQMTKALKQNACVGGFVVTSFKGMFNGTPNTQYWIGIQLSSITAGQSSTWNNQNIVLEPQ